MPRRVRVAPPILPRRRQRSKSSSGRKTKKKTSLGRVKQLSRRLAVLVRRLNAPVAVLITGAILFALVLAYTLMLGGDAGSDTMLLGGDGPSAAVVGLGGGAPLGMGRLSEEYFASIVDGERPVEVERFVAKRSIRRGSNGGASGGAQLGYGEAKLAAPIDADLHALVYDADHAINSSSGVLALIDSFIKTQEDGVRAGAADPRWRKKTPAPRVQTAVSAAEEAEFEAVLDSLDIETLLNVTAGRLTQREIIRMFKKKPNTTTTMQASLLSGGKGGKKGGKGETKGGSSKSKKKKKKSKVPKMNMTKFKITTKGFLKSIGRNVTLYTTGQLRDAVIVGLSDVLSLAITTLQSKTDFELEALAKRQTMDPLKRYLHSIGQPALPNEFAMSIRERSIEALVDETGIQDDDLRDKEAEAIRKLSLRELWKLARAHTFTFVRRR